MSNNPFEDLKISMIRHIGKDVASRGLLPEHALGYLRYLAARCLELLNGEDIDVVALRALSTQAAGTAFTLATRITDERKRNEFWSHCGTILKTWVAPMLTGAADNLISSGAQHLMIGS
jgi:hypothetical protein